MASSTPPSARPTHDASMPRSLTACTRGGTTVAQEPIHAESHLVAHRVGNCFRPPRALVVWCINNAMSSMPSPDGSGLMSKPNSLGPGNNRANRKQWPNSRRALAKYSKRYRGSGEKPGGGGRQEESKPPTLEGGSGGDGFLRLIRPEYQKPKRKQILFGTKKRKTQGELSQ
jgi:hypothetical protein